MSKPRHVHYNFWHPEFGYLRSCNTKKKAFRIFNSSACLPGTHLYRNEIKHVWIDGKLTYYYQTCRHYWRK